MTVTARPYRKLFLVLHFTDAHEVGRTASAIVCLLSLEKNLILLILFKLGFKVRGAHYPTGPNFGIKTLFT